MTTIDTTSVEELLAANARLEREIKGLRTQVKNLKGERRASADHVEREFAKAAKIAKAGDMPQDCFNALAKALPPEGEAYRLLLEWRSECRKARGRFV